MKTLYLLFIFCLLCSCVTTVDEPVEDGVFLYQGSALLKGLALKDLTVVSDEIKTNIQVSDISRTVSLSKPAVVNLFIKSSEPYNLHLLPSFLPGPKVRVNVDSSALGSGFIIHPAGYIITNSHVVDNSQKVLAVTAGGEKYELEIIAREPMRDLALLKIIKPNKPFSFLKFNKNSDDLEGEMVIAIGNPLGLGHSVTMGIVSQTHRNLSTLQEESDTLYLQTDAAINPGSSGGPLISLARGCIGVNTAGIQNGGSLNFAIPAEDVLEFLEKVLRGEGTSKLELK
jgi:S1-C subfamily serine protease